MANQPTHSEFENRVAIVTGSGQNIGRGIALALARQGASVVVNGRSDMSKLEAVCEEIRALGAKALPVLADVSDPKAVQNMVDTAVAELGSVDIAISNVGRRHHQPLLKITPDDWDSIIKSNLSSAFYLARAVLPHMQERKWGRIIHISGRDGFFVKENRAHNVTAKAGLHAFAKAIALEFGEHGVTANTVAPGLLDTSRDLDQYPDYANMVKKRVANMPARRIGEVEDIAEACSFLVSDRAGFITGQLLHVNGGEFMY